MPLKKRYCALAFGLLFSMIGIAGCEGDFEIAYHFTGLDAQHAENTGSKPALSNADTIPANAYVLRLYLFPVELSRKGRYLDPETPPYNVNRIKRMTIQSDQDFDVTHPAGTQLSDLFEIFDGTYFTTTSTENLDFSTTDTPYFYEHPEPEFVDLLLMSPPTLAHRHRFTVQLDLQDSTIFADTTTSIYLR